MKAKAPVKTPIKASQYEWDFELIGPEVHKLYWNI